MIQVLALAGGIHLVNYYRDGAQRLSPVESARHAIQVGWLPCVLSAVTTAIGMASLMVSQLTPIRSFGAYSAVGVLITTALLLVAVPHLLAALKMRVSHRRDVTGKRNFDRPGLTDRLANSSIAMTVVFGAVMLAAGMGMSRIQTSVRIETLFNRESRILADYDWLEKKVGPLVPIEVLVDFNPQSTWSVTEQVQIVDYFDRKLASRPEVGGTLSATTFLPEMSVSPTNGRKASQTMANAQRQLISGAMSQLMESKMVAAPETGGRKWRIRGFVSAGTKLDYAHLLRKIENDFSSVLVDKRGHKLLGISVQTTGTMPMVHRIQHQLLDDLKNSFLLAFGIILVVMTIMQGSVLAGMIAMIHNVFPTLLLFGGLGWLNVPVDIGTVMTAWMHPRKQQQLCRFHRPREQPWNHKDGRHVHQTE